ncbi:MAG: hypoxanthine phosphoribosyltransferase [Eubacteriales bacterium]|nr:hypoxanthine phosphoribosyltransferase [Eubacteriales bacterium]
MSGIDKILVSREEISKKVKELGERISKDYKGQDLLLVGVLKGAVVFMADLLREITIPVEVDMISVSSYGSGTDSTGIVKIVKDLDVNIKDRHVLIVEDLIDTGLTLQHLKELLATREPLSVKVCTIFDKPTRRIVDVPIEYNGISIPNYFVIGYGLDYAGEYRNLPDLCTMKQI